MKTLLALLIVAAVLAFLQGCGEDQPPAPVLHRYVYTLQPDAASGKDAFISMILDLPANADRNYCDEPSLYVSAWSVESAPSYTRALLSFDLSFVPLDARIEEATLGLYNDPDAGMFEGRHLPWDGPNDGVLQLVIGAWDESSVTWNTQPAVAGSPSVSLPASSDEHQDYVVNVKELVQEWVSHPKDYHGFMLMLRTEAKYRALTFASSDHPNPRRHPSLHLSYTSYE